MNLVKKKNNKEGAAFPSAFSEKIKDNFVIKQYSTQIIMKSIFVVFSS
jgi:hypothetical protein